MTLAKLTKKDCMNLWLIAGLEQDPELRSLIERLSLRDESCLPVLWEALAVRGRVDLAERLRRVVED